MRMSNGMWTKHITEGGKVFYYNAEQNRSLWQPPPDSMVHEAPNLKPIILSSSSSSLAQPLKLLNEVSLSQPMSRQTSLDATSSTHEPASEDQWAKNHAM
ncbi:hypothetical protein EON65_07170 [archaeon]|nr:MAG: hypothetical protein EON65_07170 [archaeon]